jgi:HSP20 family protein
MSLFTTSKDPSSCACAEVEQLAARRPRSEVEETDGAYALTVFLPGVTKDSLEITDEDGELRITGKRAQGAPANAAVLHPESSHASFEQVLAHDNAVDTGKIQAELRDGVLSLALAKAESAKPRKISVN